MIDLRLPRFHEGQPVQAAVDLYNDGSHPEREPDDLLIVAGGFGEVVQVGRHAEANIPLYMVDFGVCVVGCLEEELVPDGEPLPDPATVDAALEAMAAAAGGTAPGVGAAA